MKRFFVPVMLVFFMAMNSCKKNDITPKPAQPENTEVAAVGPANGTYKIINFTTYNANVNAAMEVAGVSQADGANIQQWSFFPNGGQTWVVTALGGGYYKIINSASGKALTVPGASATVGTQLKQYPFTGDNSQLWKIEKQDNNAYKITNRGNKLVVTLQNNSTGNGAKIQQQTTGANGQYWLFQPDWLPQDNTIPTKNITWSTEATKISHSGIGSASYARVHRINSTTLILTYQFGKSLTGWEDIAIRRSTDNGETWGTPHIIKNIPLKYWGVSTPETIVLKNGWVILAFVGRGKPDINPNSNVQLCLSKDKGLTWSAPKIIATGRSWEPAMIQLPNNEVQVFYSSEAAWWPSDNVQQEILMVRVKSETSWGAPQRVAYTSGKRDGMPVPLVLKDNKGIVFPVESVNAGQSAWMNWSSIYSSWRYADGVASVANGRRWLATVNGIWGGAPYIIQLPSGETILSVQDNGGRQIPHWRKSTMIVMVGNSIAKNFTNVSYPWPGLPVDEGAIENSLFLKDSSTVMAVSSRIFADGHSEVYWKKGTIN